MTRHILLFRLRICGHQQFRLVVGNFNFEITILTGLMHQFYFVNELEFIGQIIDNNGFVINKMQFVNDPGIGLFRLNKYIVALSTFNFTYFWGRFGLDWLYGKLVQSLLWQLVGLLRGHTGCLVIIIIRRR